MNPPEGCPTDPYIEGRKQKEALKTTKTPTDFDKLKQFMEMDRKVLRFFCVWDNTDEMYGERRKFILHVSLWIIWMIIQCQNNLTGLLNIAFEIFLKLLCAALATQCDSLKGIK